MSFSLTENAKIAKVLAPIDRNNNALAAVWLSAKNCRKISFLVECGVMHASTANMATTLYVADDASGTHNAAIGANADLTLPFYHVRAAATDTWTKTTVASSTFNITNADDGKAYIIEVDTQKMGTFTASSVTYSADYVRLAIATPGAVSCIMSVTAIMSGLRYQEDSPPTAIT